MKFFVASFYILASFAVFLFETRRKRLIKPDALFFFNIFYGLSYFLAPIFFIIDSSFVPAHFSVIKTDELYFFVAFLYSTIFYLVVLFSMRFLRAVLKSEKRMLKYSVKAIRINHYLFIFTLVVLGSIGLMVYVNGYGGVREVVENINLIRTS